MGQVGTRHEVARHAVPQQQRRHLLFSKNGKMKNTKFFSVVVIASTYPPFPHRVLNDLLDDQAFLQSYDLAPRPPPLPVSKVDTQED